MNSEKPLMSGSFINREEELKALRSHFNEVLAGNGRVVIIVGEAGIGKTRLIDELAKSISEHIIYLKGRSLFHEHTDPYLPFIEAFKQYIERETGSEKIQEENLSIGLSFISESNITEDFTSEPSGLPIGLLPVSERDVTDKKILRLDLNEARDRMFEYIVDFLYRISSETPVILFIDDMQWADASSLQLFHYIARSIKNYHVLLIGAYRPEDALTVENSPLLDTLRRLRLDKLMIELSLKRLALKDIDTMIKKLLGRGDVPAPFIRKLYEESEGNPYFIEEVLRALVEEGVINPQAYIWDFSIDLSKIRVPNTIRDVINRRIMNLDENTKKVLMNGSVLGTRFKYNLLMKTIELPEDELLDILDKLCKLNIIHEEPESEEYVFDHVQIRSVIYNSMSKSRVRIIHKKCGEIIETVNADNIDEVVYSLARHFSLGKVPEKAYRYSYLAAQKAKKSLALNEACNYYIESLSATEELEESPSIIRTKIEICIELCILYRVLGELEHALEYGNRALKSLLNYPDTALKAKILKEIGLVHNATGNYSEGENYLTESLKAYTELKNTENIGDINRLLGVIHWRMGEYKDAEQHYKESLKIAVQFGIIHLLALTYIDLGNLHGELGDLDKSSQFYRQAIEVLEKIKDYDEIARAYNNLGDNYLKRQQWNEAVKYFEKSKESASKVESIRYIAWANFNLAECYIRLGNPNKALELNLHAQKTLEHVHDNIGLQGVYKNFGLIYTHLSEWDKALENFNESLKLTSICKTPWNEGEIHLELGRMYKKKNDFEKSREHLNKAQKIFATLGSINYEREASTELKNLPWK